MIAIKKVRRKHDDCGLASGVERKAANSRFFVPLSLFLSDIYDRDREIKSVCVMMMVIHEAETTIK